MQHILQMLWGPGGGGGGGRTIMKRAQLVARACLDTAFEDRLLQDAAAAASELGIETSKRHKHALWDNASCNYYHLSPHIRAHVLCATPRARYVFFMFRFPLMFHGVLFSSFNIAARARAVI
jgi:hypothetical protein